MFSIEFLPGFIMGIREGLEAFLIIAIMLEYLGKTNRQSDKKLVKPVFSKGMFWMFSFIIR